MKSRSRWFRALSMGLVVGLVALAGCGDDAEEGSAAAGTSGGDEWQAGADQKWKDVLKAGKEEGSVVVDGPPELGQSTLAEDFERDTGIQLELATGESAARHTAMVQQAQANRLQLDVSVNGGTPLFDMIPEGLVASVKDNLLVPSVAEPSNWTGGELKWMDKEGQYLLQTSDYVYAWVVVNTDAVDPESLATWDALLDPKLKGRITVYDPTTPGPGQSAASFYLDALGEDFVRGLYVEQDPVIARNRRQLVEGVARGKFDIAIGAVQSDVESFKEQGLPVDAVLPADGKAALAGGSSVVKLPANANGSPTPHPNAGIVFLNWFASRPGQESFDRHMLEASRRTDVEVDGIPEYIVPQDGREYIDTFAYDWYAEKRPEIAKQLLEIVQ